MEFKANMESLQEDLMLNGINPDSGNIIYAIAKQQAGESLMYSTGMHKMGNSYVLFVSNSMLSIFIYDEISRKISQNKIRKYKREDINIQVIEKDAKFYEMTVNSKDDHFEFLIPRKVDNLDNQEEYISELKR